MKSSHWPRRYDLMKAGRRQTPPERCASFIRVCVRACVTEIEGEITRASVGGSVCVCECVCEPEKECECKQPFHMKETPCRDKTG